MGPASFFMRIAVARESVLRNGHPADPAGDLVRAVHQQLSVVHAGEYFDVGFRTEGEEVPGLRPGDEALLGPVPEVDVGAVDGFQFVGIDVLVAVPDGFPLAGGPGFPAFVQHRVDVVRMEHPFPEAGATWGAGATVRRP